MIRTRRQLDAAARKGLSIIHTMREGFSLDDGTAIRFKLAQLELFETKPMPGGFVPQEDGLFEGFSQTWRAT